MMHHHITHGNLYANLQPDIIDQHQPSKRKPSFNGISQHMHDGSQSKKVKNGKVDLFKQFQDQVESQNPPRLVSFKRKVSSSRYKGVLFVKSQNKWRAQVCLGGKKKYIGSYDSEVEAAVSRDKKIKQLFGDRPELLNFPATTTNSIDFASSFPHNFNVNAQMNIYPQLPTFGAFGPVASQLRRNTNGSYGNFDEHGILVPMYSKDSNQAHEDNHWSSSQQIEAKWSGNVRNSYADPIGVYAGYPVADYE